MGEARRRQLLDPSYGKTSLVGTIYYFNPVDGSIDDRQNIDSETLKSGEVLAKKARLQSHDLAIVTGQGFGHNDAVSVVPRSNILNIARSIVRDKPEEIGLSRIFKTIDDIAKESSKYLIFTMYEF